MHIGFSDLVKYYLPLTLWVVALFAASVTPANELPDISFWQSDKFVHISFYLIMTLLLRVSLIKRYTLPKISVPTALWIFLVCFGYGLSIEFIQEYFVLGRYFDIFDVLANGLGCLIGLAISTS